MSLVDRSARPVARARTTQPSPASEPRRIYRSAKRVLDVVAAVTGLVLSAPIQALIAGLIRTFMGRGVLFRQARVGEGGAVFDIVKFRTMHPAGPHVAGPEHDRERSTRLGRLLRATSVDELPTLWNVMKGDMSLVGPRPLPARYLPRYSQYQARRHEVPAGITGWAQIQGRNAVSWDERLALDVWYVDNCSFLLDLSILAKTVGRVISRQGIYTSLGETMPEFVKNERATR